MSRIIVKNLPEYITEERLKEHFQKKGDVTDVKLRKNHKGESRRFAFVGFKSDSDAEEAVRYFNGSFIDTAKLSVQEAKSFADPDVPKSFKEKRREAYLKVKEQEEMVDDREERDQRKREFKKQKQSKRSTIDEDISNNPALQDFIEATKPATQSKSWSNGIVVNAGGAPSNSLLEQALAMKDSGAMEDKFQNNVADEIFKLAENESDEEYDKADQKDEDVEDEPMIALDSIPQDQAKNDEAVSDLDWLKQRRIRISDSSPTEVQEVKEKKLEVTAEKTQKKNTKPAPVLQRDPEEIAIEKIRSTGRLFLRNILYSAKEEEFRNLFSKYGELEEVHVAVDTRTGQSKGFCYIKFVHPDEAVEAYIELDKQIYQGRLLHIIPAEGKKDHRLDEFDLKNLPLKKQKELKKKNDASKTQFSWNSLFLNQDAVMDTIASDLGVSKSSLIDPENSSSAVKQALAEAHVIGDVRKFFEGKGVDLLKFQGKERDDSVILVKNIPHGTSEAEILELFTPYGELKRVVMPPSGTIAIVQYRDLPSGRSAFTKLSYRRFKKSILYLEKGPQGLFTREPSKDEDVDNDVVEEAKEIQTHEKDIQDDGDVFEGPTVSVFIKNLNFSTTAAELTDLLSNLDGFVLATIKTKPDPRDSAKTQSMGYGFAEFRTKEQASVAVKAIEGTVLDGHKLTLKLSHRQTTTTTTTNGAKAKKAISSKVIVKNLPFEATRKDVFELFNSFGQLKSVRVPKKFDKSARGFAFVEFLLPKEAESAMDQLQGVHLLGRRLVMQYAEQEGDAEAEIEKMTSRVKRQVATQQLGALTKSGKRKLDLEEEDED